MKKSILLYLFYLCLILTIKGYGQVTADTNSFIIEDITFQNNTKTKTNVLRENLPYRIGVKVSEQGIHAGIQQLRNLQFFNKVVLSPRAGTEPGKLKLIIKIEERRWPSLRFKGGFSELNGWFITPVSLNMDNILGYGNYLDLNMTFGDRVTSINLNYINPNIFKSDLDFYFKMYVRGTDFIEHINTQKFVHKVSQGGYFFGFKSRNKYLNKFLFGVDLYMTTPDSFLFYHNSKNKYYDLPDRIKLHSLEEQRTNAFSLYYEIDKRDQYFYPCYGWWFGAWFSQANVRIAKSDKYEKFTRLIIDVRKYQHLMNNFVLAFRLKLAGISADAPFYEKFYLGGPNSLRGYSDRSLSPIGGGERLYQGGLELRFPITTKNYPKHLLTGILFVDSGSNTIENIKVSTDDIKGSYGFGFRIKLPFIQLLRMDIAYPMNGAEGRVHFSLGHTF